MNPCPYVSPLVPLLGARRRSAVALRPPRRRCASPKFVPAWSASARPCSTAPSRGIKANILGVLENIIGTHRNLILARLEGGPLANTGVIAGMSGSPVYIDGKLIGAVSYSLGSFSKEPIAGITPIAEMTDATAFNDTRPRRRARCNVEFPLTPRRPRPRPSARRSTGTARSRDAPRRRAAGRRQRASRGRRRRGRRRCSARSRRRW